MFDDNDTIAPFRVSPSMTVLKSKNKKIDYIVLKIDGKSYSTSFKNVNGGHITGVLQRVETVGVGKQNQLWIKDKFTEGTGHQQLDKEKPFELNVYFNEEVKDDNP